MKNYTKFAVAFGFVFVGIFFTQCGSSEKLLDKGQYDRAFSKAVKALRKDPSDAKEKNIMLIALTRQNRRDSIQINNLKGNNSGDSWFQVLQLSRAISARRDKVKSLEPDVTIKYPFENYSAIQKELISKTSDLLYKEGQDLMKENNKMSYRAAYYKFSKIGQVSSGYKDSKRLADKAKNEGTNYIFLEVSDKTLYKADERMKNYMQTQCSGALNDAWTIFSTVPPARRDGEVEVVTDNIFIGDLSENKETKTFSKEITEYEYIKDEKGNVKKNEAGNDMKREVKKTIESKVVFRTTSQPVEIHGTVIFKKGNRILHKEPVALKKTFVRNYYVVEGNVEALDLKTKKEVLEAKKEPQITAEEYVKTLYDEYFLKLFAAVRDGKKVFNN